jgi:glycosyltransferase involved in cell wall biosynthesis
MNDSFPNIRPSPLSIAFMNSIAADVWRGGEKWMVNAAAGLSGRGHRVVCIGRDNALWLRHAAARGVETLSLPIHSDFDPFIIRKLCRIFKEREIDLLCCNFEKDVRLGGIAGRIAKVKRIFVRKGLALIYDKLRYRLSYRFIVDDIISPAGFIKKQFAKFPWLDQARIHVIPNGVALLDTAAWDRGMLRRAAGVAEGEPILFGAGRIFSQKGFDYLVDALLLLHRQGIKAHGAIAGGGEEEVVRSQAARLGLTPYIHLLGHRDDVLQLMYGADIFILSSIDEGLPNVVLEAMSVGTPVVAADAGGTAEIITDGVNGYVVPTRDAAAIARRAGELLRDNRLRAEIGTKGFLTVQERFSIPVMVERVEALFSSAVADTLRKRLPAGKGGSGVPA